MAHHLCAEERPADEELRDHRGDLRAGSEVRRFGRREEEVLISPVSAQTCIQKLLLEGSRLTRRAQRAARGPRPGGGGGAARAAGEIRT